MKADDRIQLNELIVFTGVCLDQENFEGYLSSFCDDAEYQVVSIVPEIAQTVAWLDLTKPALESLLMSADRHTWNTGLRTHHIAAATFSFEPTHADTVSSVSIFRTDAEGNTKLYAVGRYYDRWVRSADSWLLARRTLQLDTRVLAPPSGMPM